MAQTRNRKRHDGRAQVRDGRGNQSRVHTVGGLLNPRRWVWASLLAVGLLCGSALSQIPGTPDAQPVHGGGKGPRHGRKGGPKVAGVKPGRNAGHVKSPGGANVKPAELESITLPPAPSEGLSAAGAPAPTPTPTDAADTPATRPREVTPGNVADGPRANTDDPPSFTDGSAAVPNVGKSLTAPTEVKPAPDYLANFPGLGGGDPSLTGIVAKVNPLSVIVDSNRVFVETFKNQDAHKRIVKELGNYPKLKVVATREEADFIVSYTDKHGFELQPGAPTASGGPGIPVPIGKLIGGMVVYKAGAKQEGGTVEKQVLWSEPEEDQDKIWWVLPGGRHPATNLTQHFIKALRRLRGEIK